VTLALCSMAMRGSSTASSHSKTVQHQIDQEQLLAGAGKVRGEASGELVKSVSGRKKPLHDHGRHAAGVTTVPVPERSLAPPR
jgi:hypothetical protein